MRQTRIRCDRCDRNAPLDRAIGWLVGLRRDGALTIRCPEHRTRNVERALARSYMVKC